MNDEPQRAMPCYQSRQKVCALKIGAMEILENNSARIAPDDDGFSCFVTRTGWPARFEGTQDDLGYYVVYEDGSTSWSSTKAFEKGYIRI